MTTQHKSLGEAWCAAAAEIAAAGVAKSGVNREQNYYYRPIDRVLDVVGPALARHGIMVSPVFDEREARAAGKTAKGNDRTRVVLRCTCTFRHFADPHARHEVVSIGEAEDAADKATNKAMAMALKYALIAAFLIPVVGADDADASPGTDNGASRGGARGGGQLDGHAIAAHCAAIVGAADATALRAATKAALQAAIEAGDEESRADFRRRSGERAADLGIIGR